MTDGTSWEECVAPSWSWASKQGAICYEDSGMVKTQGYSGLMHDCLDDYNLVQVRDVAVATKDNNPLGQVLSGVLRLEGYLFRFKAKPKLSAFKLGKALIHVFCDLDNFEFDGQCQYVFLPCVHTAGWFDAPYNVLTGLLLNLTGKEKGQYERVGIGRSKSCGFFDFKLKETASKRPLLDPKFYEEIQGSVNNTLSLLSSFISDREG